MSDHIPFEVQVEIIKKLPVKSLLQFRSVSKQWKSLIDSSAFIAGYGVRQSQPQRLFVRDNQFDIGLHFLIDSNTFSHQEFAPSDHKLDELFRMKLIVGSSHGLLCLYGHYQEPGYHRNSYHPQSMMSVIWNPSIRKLVAVEVHHVGDAPAPVALGFGVCPITLDPTIVKITKTVPWKVEIFTLGAGCWRISSSNLLNKPIFVLWSQVAIGNFIYWVAFELLDATDIDGMPLTKSLIVSFYLTTEQFRAVNLADSLAHTSRTSLSVSNIRESLAVVEYIDIPNKVCAVWMMNREVPDTFTKLFTINTSYAAIRVLVFTESGEPIMEKLDDYNEPSLVVYKPSSQTMYDIGIFGKSGSFSFCVGSYMETLLLVDELDCGVYSDIIRDVDHFIS